jgi:hypothetical protein
VNAITVTKTLILGVPSVFLVTVTAVWLYRKTRDRRADREWAAGIAQGVHDAEYLRWLDKELFPEGSEQT